MTKSKNLSNSKTRAKAKTTPENHQNSYQDDPIYRSNNCDQIVFLKTTFKKWI